MGDSKLTQADQLRDLALGAVKLMAKWIFKTRAGLAEIIQQRGDNFALVFDGEALENHTSPAAAAEALANGTCFWPSAGDPSQLGIPEEIGEWTLVP
jgi:hypothetical protein